MTEPVDLAPLQLVERQPGEYCLLLVADDMLPVMDTFAAFGYYGNGPGWEGAAQSAVRAFAPEIAGRFEYDSEGDAFVAIGGDLAALRRLGMLLRRALLDRDFLAQLLRAGEPIWFA